MGIPEHAYDPPKGANGSNVSRKLVVEDPQSTPHAASNLGVPGSCACSTATQHSLPPACPLTPADSAELQNVATLNMHARWQCAQQSAPSSPVAAPRSPLRAGICAAASAPLFSRATSCTETALPDAEARKSTDQRAVQPEAQAALSCCNEQSARLCGRSSSDLRTCEGLGDVAACVCEHDDNVNARCHAEAQPSSVSSVNVAKSMECGAGPGHDRSAPA